MEEQNIESIIHQGDHSKGLEYFEKGCYQINSKINWKKCWGIIQEIAFWASRIGVIIIALLMLWFIGVVLFSI